MSVQEADMDLEKLDPAVDIVPNMLEAVRKYGKKPFSQVVDIAQLALGFGGLTPKEYYTYRLFDDETYSFSEKKRFIGKKTQESILLKSTSPLWGAVAHDKLVYYGLLKGLGFPVPQTEAIYHPFRRFGEAPTLCTPEDLARYVRDGMRFPCFGKPVSGMYSVGASALSGYDPADDCLILSSGKRVSVDSYVEQVSHFRKDGYLFQRRLDVHDDLNAICGDRIGTARLMVLVREEGAEIFQAVWKIPTGDNVADNFWRSGNMLGALDIESGRVLRVVRGVGVDQAEVTSHPDTDKPLVGITLPDWATTKSLCLSAAESLSELSMQAWDVAMTTQGPVLVEVNIGGDFNLPQIATGKGMMTDAFGEFLAKRIGLTAKI